MSKLSTYRASLAVPRKMQALVLSGTGWEHLAVKEVPVPTPGPGQLLARVDAAGVCTSLLKIIEQGPAHSYFNGWDPAKRPVILGDEGSITIVQVGEKLKGTYKAGQRYALQPAVDVGPINHREHYHGHAAGMRKTAIGYTLGGNLAQYILIQEEVLEGQCLLPLPADDLPYFAVSMAEPISCVVSAQERQIHLHKKDAFAPRVPELGMLRGGTTVVIGAGAMGRMHVELALRFKPANLVVADLMQERLDIVQRQLRAKAAKAGVNLVTVQSSELKATVMGLTNNRGADDIVMAVGIQPVQQAALELLGPGGVANLFGGLPRGKNFLNVDAIRVHYEEIKLVGSSGGAPSDLKTTLAAIASGAIDPGNYVYGIAGLQHAPQVLELIKQGKVDGKVIIYPHAPVPELTRTDGWDARREMEHLETRLG